MKSELYTNASMLQQQAVRPQSEGFTLIELLVVIIIIGILSAIALPSFLNQANKARESEGKQYRIHEPCPTGLFPRAATFYVLHQ